MTDTKYSMKMEKQFKSKRAGTLLAAMFYLLELLRSASSILILYRRRFIMKVFLI